MKRLLLILLILVSFAAFSQQEVMTTGYKYIKNDVAAWSVSSGTFVNGGTFPNDYIQCNVAGTMYVPSTQAYGEWYFDYYRANTSVYSFFGFISNSTGVQNGGTVTGYVLDHNSGGVLRLTKRVNGAGTLLFTTATNYIAVGTKYSFKITRSVAGVFTVYIKGGAYGNIWTIISVATGSNPATDNTTQTSLYFAIQEFNAVGDQYSNVRFKPSTGYNTVIK